MSAGSGGEALGRLVLEGCVCVRRLNRFVVEAEAAGGGRGLLHLRNTGRLLDLVYPGARLLYEPRPRRRTAGVVVGVEVGGGLAALIDPPTQVAVFEEAWRRGLIGWLRGWGMAGREAVYRGSRLDYLLNGPGGASGVMEVKSAVYLSGGGFCMYPDTVSARGRRHVDVLVEGRREGLRAVIAFVAAHPLCTGFRPCCEVDPILCEKLRRAVEAGVEVRAVKMHLEGGEVLLDSDDLPVSLE
ncbi:MAG: DNA/RNA nuclease SfsA [Nitrososphaerota archaeon]|nr:DNA/RNA nuclease SfsA [Candidatus Calditenuaceae archaeon]MDW8073922.1 DNA/RNA nuclease SfsA [Nitrososphaerota archaeon]